jgi:hypothetical protein
MRGRLIALMLVVAVCSAARGETLILAGEEKLPEGAKVASLEVYPAKIELSSRYAYRQLLLTAVLASGERMDVTRMARIEPLAGLAEVSPRGLVRGKADGSGSLACTFGGQSVRVPLEVRGLGAEYPVSFVRDVMPAISKMGCNAGTCHGSAKGKNGFKLSLRGYDPLSDHRALTDDLAGRRFNRAAPDQSLMLLKASGSVPHTGGVLSRPGEPYYELLRAWITAGVKFDGGSPRPTSLEVFPKDVTIPLPGMKQQLAVTAAFSDGSVRDVSAEAFVEASNIEVLSVDKQGLATALRRGEAALLVRYEGNYAVATVTVMGDRSGFAWKDAPANSYIDELVYVKLKKLRVEPSGPATGAEFLRRVSLDLTGLPPKPEEVRGFLADGRDARAKRDEVIDRLIGSPAFLEHWTNKWADLLQVNPKMTSPEVASATRKWIRQALADNVPYDKFVYAILTASGSTAQNPAAAYYEVARTPEMAAETSTQLFLGVRFSCNKCHDHPFERWTQNQYYQLAAYFARIDRKPAPGSGMTDDRNGKDPDAKRPLVEMIADSGAGDERHPTTNQVVEPKFPFLDGDPPPAGLPRRVQFAAWATSARNRYFAQSYVNRVWSYLLGVGLIEPVDDIRAGNPPSNPELLHRLTADFVAGGFNTRELIRLICKSRVYQQSIAANAWNADDATNYSHALARRLPAETLYDAIHQALGSPVRLPGGMLADQLVDPAVSSPDGFLDLFGRPPRESACECERSNGVSLGQALNLINGPTVADAIDDPNNAVAKLVQSQPDDRKLIDELFVRILNRPPTEAEIAHCLPLLGAYDQDFEKVSATVAAHEKTLDARQPAWESRYQGTVVWHETVPVEIVSSGGATLSRQDGGVILAGGKSPEKDKYTVVLETDLVGITGIRLEALADASLPAKGPGRADNGNFVLNELQVAAAPRGQPGKIQPVKLERAAADFSQSGYDVAGAIDGNPGTAWAVSPQFGQDHAALFEIAGDLGFPGGTRLVVVLDQQFGGKHTLGRFRLALTTSPRPLKLKEELPAQIAAIVSAAADKRTGPQKQQLAAYFRSLDPDHARLSQGLASYARCAGQKRMIGAQDLVWALINSPAFLFNR